MVIIECYIEAFGKIKNKGISFRPGLNIITGDNETGKTTIADFIKCMLFGVEENDKEYRHYLPYEFTGKFGGRLKVLKNGSFYEITRDFMTGSVKVEKKSTGAEVENPEAWMKEATRGMTRDEFESSGYIAQNAFLLDAEKYKESIEKDAQRKREEQIKNQYVAARSYLFDVRRGWAEKQDETVGVDLQNTEDLLKEELEEYRELCERLPKEEQEYTEAAKAFRTEVERVDKSNQEKQDNLHSLMVREKQKFEKYASANEAATSRKNVAGVILLVLGVLALGAAFFFRESFGIKTTGHEYFLYLMIGFGVAAALLIAGIVVTIAIFASKRKAIGELVKRDHYQKRVEKAEKDYQSFYDGEPGTRETVEDRAGREAILETIHARLEEEKARMAELEVGTKERAEKQQRLAKAYKEQQEIRSEIKAIDIAVAAFEKLGSLNSESEEQQLSYDATEILHELDPKRKTVISLESEIIFVVENGRRLLFSDLSTSSMQEVLFAVRLAILNKKDPGKTLPLILDESLAHLDADRLQSALSLLRACSRQVVLLSCQSREKKTMES